MFGATREEAIAATKARIREEAAKQAAIEQAKATARLKAQAAMAQAVPAVAQRRVEAGLPPLPSPTSPALPGMSDGKIFGLPKTVVIGGGVAAAVLIVLAMRKKK